jgi:hypothetical protein
VPKGVLKPTLLKCIPIKKGVKIGYTKGRKCEQIHTPITGK